MRALCLRILVFFGPLYFCCHFCLSSIISPCLMVTVQPCMECSPISKKEICERHTHKVSMLLTKITNNFHIKLML